MLSVEGEEHVENNPYENYFASDGIESLPGFDTFWYTWVAAHANAKLIR